MNFVKGINYLNVCTEQDIPELSRIGYKSYIENYMYLWQEERYGRWYMDISFSEEKLSSQFKDPRVRFYLVMHDQRSVGLIKTVRGKRRSGETDLSSLELEKIYILRHESGKGIGTDVINELISRVKKEGIGNIWLKSMDSSPAVAFYQKNGFVIKGTERLPYEGFKEEYRNMVIMESDI